MKKYEEYKDSGVEWIGEIPSSWGFIPIKYILISSKDSIRTGPFGSSLKLADFKEQGIRVYNQRSVYDEDFSKSEVFISEEKFKTLKSFEVNEGDILITSRGTIGKMTIVPNGSEKGVLHPCLIRLRTNDNKILKRYLWWLINHSIIFITSVINESNSTTIEVIYSDTLSTIHLPIPTIEEQKNIIEYFDQKVAQIDDLIEKKKRKIELLKEYRTALINRVVTKGLDPDVEMKDSGVEWIGDIPRHWEIKPLKYMVNLILEKGQPTSEDIKISPENVESNTGNCFNHHSEYSGEGFKFETGDVLLNKLRIYLKKIFYTVSDGYSMGEMIVLRPGNISFGKYIYFILFHQGLIDFWDAQSTGVKMPRVSPEVILDTKFPYPLPLDQKKIGDYLDNKTSETEKLIQSEERKIEILKEYRQSLISNVVTGKVDVRKN